MLCHILQFMVKYRFPILMDSAMNYTSKISISNLAKQVVVNYSV